MDQFEHNRYLHTSSVTSMENQQIAIGCHKSNTEHEKLCRLLQCVESDEESKLEAEQAILELEKLDDYPIYLTEILSIPSRPTNVRILASDKLKKFVKAHWCETDDSFVLPAIQSKNKAKIKELLLTGLSETTIEVRKAVANIISTIVPWDWPHDWPGLIDILVGGLNGENMFAVHGAMLVLNKFDVLNTGEQTLDAVAVILREMNRIFAGENYSEEIRSLACNTFFELVSQTAQHERPDLTQHYLRSAVQLFYATSMQTWTSKDCSSQLKIDILNALIEWMEYIPKYIFNFLADMLRLVWDTLIDCAKTYQTHVINGGEKSTETDSFPKDLVEVMLTFTDKLMDGQDRYSLSISDCELLEDEWFYLQDCFSTPHAIRHLIMLVQVTEKEIERWNTDFDDFVQKEDTDNCSRDGIRRTARELIDCARLQNRTVANSLIVVIMEYLEEENERRINGRSGVGRSWKSHEAFLLAFSVMENRIVSKKNGSWPRYDVVPFLENIVLADLNDSASHPLLVGRCLSLGGIYSEHMPSKTAFAFMKATVNGLRENQPPCVQICATKAVYLWYDSHNAGRFHNHIMLMTYVPTLFESFFTLATLARNSKSTGFYSLILEGISSLMTCDRAYAASIATRIYDLTETALLTYIVRSATHAWKIIFEELMLHPKSIQLLQTRLTKTLLGLMTNTPPNRHSEGSIAIDIVQILVKHSIPPMGNFLIDPLLPATCNYIVVIKDSWILEDSGLHLIETYLSLAFQQVIDYQDESGRYGAEYILQVIVYALNEKSFTIVEKVCAILTLLIEKAWYQMRQGIDELLKTLLHRMQQKESALITREILMIYAHLIHRQSDTIFNYVATSLTLAEQKSFLESVVSEGFCKEYYSINGERRETMKFALEKALEHGVTNLSSPLHQMTWKGSKQPIPLLVKLCRMMVNDHSSKKPSGEPKSQN